MNKPLFSKKLGTLLGIVLILSLNGCAFLEQFTVPGEDPEDAGGPVTSTPQPPTSQVPDGYYPGESTTAIYHTVRKGESLFEISEMYGRGFRDVAAWNNLRPPYVIYPGQELLVSTPPSEFPSTPPVASVSPVPAAPSVTPTPISTPVASAPIGGGAVYHTVQSGDTLYKIATRYGQNFQQVALWNNLAPPYRIGIGQNLLVSPPAGGATSTLVATPSYTPPVTTYTPPVSNFTPAPVVSSGGNFHTVARGDTLFSIARRYNTSVNQLASWNRLAPPYNLSIGQSLQVSAGSTVASAPTPVAGASYHTVARGDTLYSLSRRYGHSVQQLAGWNNLAPPYNLSLGQTLQVAPSATVTSSGFRTYTVDAGTFLNTPSPKPRVRSTQFHVVKRGESLASIAQRYNMTTHELSVWNGIGKPYTVYPGQRLLILSP